MFFLMRMAFWFSLVLLALPLNPADGSDPGATVGPIQALFAARAAVSDISGMCERQPEVCDTGSAAIHTIGTRAKAAYQIIDHQLSSDADGDAVAKAIAEGTDTLSTGGVAKQN